MFIKCKLPSTGVAETSAVSVPLLASPTCCTPPNVFHLWKYLLFCCRENFPYFKTAPNGWKVSCKVHYLLTIIICHPLTALPYRGGHLPGYANHFWQSFVLLTGSAPYSFMFLSELGQAQPFFEQVLRKDREAWHRDPEEGLSVGDEPRQDWEDGRGGAEVETEGPGGHSAKHGETRWAVSSFKKNTGSPFIIIFYDPGAITRRDIAPPPSQPVRSPHHSLEKIDWSPSLFSLQMQSPSTLGVSCFPLQQQKLSICLPFSPTCHMCDLPLQKWPVTSRLLG